MTAGNLTLIMTLMAQPVWPAQVNTVTRQHGAGISLSNYDSELAAVVAAVNEFNPRSVREDREFIGAILEYQGRYYFTVSAGQAGQDKIHATISFPKKMRMQALWHTHGGPGPGREYFSDVDTKLAREIGKPFYLADYTGGLKVFQPTGQTMSFMHARRLGLPAANGYSKGQLILVPGVGGLLRITAHSQS